jgi:hypothetical protein
MPPRHDSRRLRESRFAILVWGCANDVGNKRSGREHVTRWEKIAVVTDKEWLRHSVNIFGYLIPGEIKAYPAAEEGDARAWVAS